MSALGDAISKEVLCALPGMTRNRVLAWTAILKLVEDNRHLLLEKAVDIYGEQATVPEESLQRHVDALVKVMEGKRAALTAGQVSRTQTPPVEIKVEPSMAPSRVISRDEAQYPSR